MFYRTTSAEDVLESIKDVAWRHHSMMMVLLIRVVTPSKDDNDFREHKFSVSGLPSFTSFQLKIVLTGTISSYPPR